MGRGISVVNFDPNLRGGIMDVKAEFQVGETCINKKKTRAIYLWTATGNEIEEVRTAIVREDDAMEYDAVCT